MANTSTIAPSTAALPFTFSFLPSFGGTGWFRDRITLRQHIDANLLLITGLATLVGGTALQVIAGYGVIGSCFNCAGMASLVIASFTKTDPSATTADRPGWKQQIDRIFLLTGIAATIATLTTAIFTTSQWLIFCSVLACVALIRANALVELVEPVKRYASENQLHKKANEDLTAQVGTLTTRNKDLATQIEDLTALHTTHVEGHKKQQEAMQLRLKEATQLSGQLKQTLETLSSEREDALKRSQEEIDVLRDQNQEFAANNERLDTLLQATELRDKGLIQRTEQYIAIWAEHDAKIAESQMQLATLEQELGLRNKELADTTRELQQVRAQLEEEVAKLTIVSDRLVATSGVQLPPSLFACTAAAPSLSPIASAAAAADSPPYDPQTLQSTI